MPIGYVAYIVRDVVPNYLTKVPIPRSLRDCTNLTRGDWMHLICFSAAFGGFVYVVTKPFYDTYITKTSVMINKSVRKFDRRVIDTIDIEDLGEVTNFCRCWKSKRLQICEDSNKEMCEQSDCLQVDPCVILQNVGFHLPPFIATHEVLREQLRRIFFHNAPKLKVVIDLKNQALSYLKQVSRNLRNQYLQLSYNLDVYDTKQAESDTSLVGKVFNLSVFDEDNDHPIVSSGLPLNENTLIISSRCGGTAVITHDRSADCSSSKISIKSILKQPSEVDDSFDTGSVTSDCCNMKKVHFNRGHERVKTNIPFCDDDDEFDENEFDFIEKPAIIDERLSNNNRNNLTANESLNSLDAQTKKCLDSITEMLPDCQHSELDCFSNKSPLLNNIITDPCELDQMDVISDTELHQILDGMTLNNIQCSSPDDSVSYQNIKSSHVKPKTVSSCTPFEVTESQKSLINNTNKISSDINDGRSNCFTNSKDELNNQQTRKSFNQNCMKDCDNQSIEAPCFSSSVIRLVKNLEKQQNSECDRVLGNISLNNLAHNLENKTYEIANRSRRGSCISADQLKFSTSLNKEFLKAICDENQSSLSDCISDSQNSFQNATNNFIEEKERENLSVISPDNCAVNEIRERRFYTKDEVCIVTNQIKREKTENGLIISQETKYTVRPLYENTELFTQEQNRNSKTTVKTKSENSLKSSVPSKLSSCNNANNSTSSFSSLKKNSSSLIGVDHENSDISFFSCSEEQSGFESSSGRDLTCFSTPRGSQCQMYGEDNCMLY